MDEARSLRKCWKVQFFHEEPRKFFPGAKIDVVIFPKGPGGGELLEKSFIGPIHEQVRDALRYIQNNVLRKKVIKRKDRPESTRFFNYLFAAIEEAVVNEVYHRSCESREPVEVRVNPDGIEVLSYPGPDASIRIEALDGEKIVGRRDRNRRIGEFVKELDLVEGRCTGIPTMRETMADNASPPPKFSTDAGWTYLLSEIPAHPDLPGIGKAHDEAIDDLTDTESRLLAFVESTPRNRGTSGFEESQWESLQGGRSSPHT